MKNRQLILAGLFVVLLVGVLWGVEQFLKIGVRANMEGYYGKINRLEQGATDVQIAVFGSSVGETGIDIAEIESQTGRTAYNFSIDGTRFQQYKSLVEKFNSTSQKAELVIFAETYFSLSPIDALTEPDRYLVHLQDDRLCESLAEIQPELIHKARYVPFYSYVLMTYRFYQASAEGWKIKLSGRTSEDQFKGFTPHDWIWNATVDSSNAHAMPILITIDTAAVKAYRKSILQLRAKGRRVVILLPPIHRDGRRLLPNLHELTNVFTSLRQDGVYFLDFSTSALSGDKKYFYNNTHLNRFGAQLFSHELSDSLRHILQVTHQLISR